MFRNRPLSAWIVGAALLVAAEGAVWLVAAPLMVTPAEAQFWGERERARPQRSGGFFQDLFGVTPRRQQGYEVPAPHGGGGVSSAPAESPRAPPARKADKDAPAPTTSIVVLGDGMADWLAYGLEDAFSEAPEIGVLRKNRINSGLIHYDPRSDLDWWHVARDLLAPEKPNYVVMMLGVSDRQNIRARDLAREAEKKEAEKKAKEQQDKSAAAKPGDKPGEKANEKPADKKAADAGKADEQTADNAPTADPEGGDSSVIAAPEPRSRAGGSLEFRSNEWAAVYSRRIDDTIAALKSKGVPVFWVGLPSIRGAKSTSEAVYLNDLYRARAEKAGIVFIDVWDGFVDEGGKFTTFGPDYEGQNRRLRAGDGVYFTRYGARKLAHYVEREIRRYMANRGPIALPTAPLNTAPAGGRPAARPLAGPVVPLTVTPENSDTLLGSGPVSTPHGDALAQQVLVKGEAMAAPRGRADDFAWASATVTDAPPRPTATPVVPLAVPTATPAPLAVPQTPAPAPLPAPTAALPAAPEAAPDATDAQPDSLIAPEPAAPAAAKPSAPRPAQTQPNQQRPRRADDARAPRPPQSVQQQRPQYVPLQQQRPQQQPQPRRPSAFGDGGPFGWLR